jgi:hypothetical protein
MNGFLEPLQTALKIGSKMSPATTFGKLFLWPLSAFGNPFMAALAAYDILFNQ